MKKITCQNCGIRFKVEDREAIKRKYCSLKCSNESQKRRIWKNCKYCNKLFWVRLSEIKVNKGKYCSKECSNKGSPLDRMRSVEERFWGNVREKDKNECWEWTGYFDKHGYGRISIKNKSVGAHRLSYMIFHDKLNELLYNPDVLILHRCDNPKCVNPHHLFEGDHMDNTQDMINKNRQKVVRGEEGGNSKLINEEVLKIRELYETNNYSQRKLGRMFDVHHGTIGDIVHRKTWTHI